MSLLSFDVNSFLDKNKIFNSARQFLKMQENFYIYFNIKILILVKSTELFSFKISKIF